MSEEGFNGKNSKFLIEVTGTNTVAWLTGTFDGGDGHGIKSREKRDGTVDVALTYCATGPWRARQDLNL